VREGKQRKPIHLAATAERGQFDGFILVPLLQERGTFRSEYGGFTLREHLGL
jgi:hypothetical protein